MNGLPTAYRRSRPHSHPRARGCELLTRYTAPGPRRSAARPRRSGGHTRIDVRLVPYQGLNRVPWIPTQYATLRPSLPSPPVFVVHSQPRLASGMLDQRIKYCTAGAARHRFSSNEVLQKCRCCALSAGWGPQRCASRRSRSTPVCSLLKWLANSGSGLHTDWCSWNSFRFRKSARRGAA